MTAIELEARKAELARQVLNIDSRDILEKLQDYLKHLYSGKEGTTNVISEEDTISKEEILAGVAEGLNEVAERRRTGTKGRTLRELINEL